MAPALVELSTSKERNSSSKKYIEDYSCMSRLNLELVEKIRFVDSPLFTKDIKKEKKEVDETFEKENSATKVMVSSETDTLSTNNVNNVNHNVKVWNKKEDNSSGHFLKCLSNENGNKVMNGNVNHHDDTQEILQDSRNIVSSITASDKSQIPQPVAKYRASNSITQLLNSQESTVKTNFSRLNSELNILGDRVNRLCTKDLSSHVACVISKSNEVLLHNQKNEKYKEFFKFKNDKKPNDNYNLLKQTFDLVNDSITDDEDTLDLKQCPPLKVKRHKSQRYDNNSRLGQS